MNKILFQIISVFSFSFVPLLFPLSFPSNLHCTFGSYNLSSNIIIVGTCFGFQNGFEILLNVVNRLSEFSHLSQKLFHPCTHHKLVLCLVATKGSLIKIGGKTSAD